MYPSGIPARCGVCGQRFEDGCRWLLCRGGGGAVAEREVLRSLTCRAFDLSCIVLAFLVLAWLDLT